jgi:hypothetical protein
LDVKLGVVLLGRGPLGAWKAFQECTPAKGGLYMECVLDGALWVKGRGREVIAPGIEGGEDRRGDGRIGVRAVEVLLELPMGMMPNGCSLWGGAAGNVFGGFVEAGATWAL